VVPVAALVVRVDVTVTAPTGVLEVIVDDAAESCAVSLGFAVDVAVGTPRKFMQLFRQVRQMCGHGCTY
jgi:hypothetical protein